MSELEEQIKQIFEVYRTTVSAKDVNAFTALYDENIHVFDMWGKWSYDGIQAWRGMVTEWFGSLGNEKVGVDFSDMQIEAASDMSIAHAIVTYRGLSAEGKELRSMQNRLTLGLKNKNGMWKIIHEHSSAPIAPETLKAILQK
ncbi:MAG: nuclear transport factor 2 family protein [Anaerolineales bacterium]|nr:nuclear transport factor 2 family protein [Anaerolineales bacterium]